MYNSAANNLVGIYGGDQLIMELVPNYWTVVNDTTGVVTFIGAIPIQVTDPNAADPGDVDGNGALNIFDLLDMLKVIGRKVTPDARMQAASDLDGNGRIDIFDLLALLKMLRPATIASS